MKNEEKAYLLAELFQVDVTDQIEKTLSTIEKSETYKNLLEHVEIAKKYSIPDAEKFIQIYEDLKFSKISTFRDALVAKATIDHLSFVSSPKYFINPFTFNEAEMKSGILNIGDLPLTYRGKEMTLTTWFEDSQITTSERIKEVNHLIDQWSLGAKSAVLMPLQQLMGKKKIQKESFFYPVGWVDSIVCVLGNIFFAFTLFSQNPLILSLRNADFYSISFWAYLFFIALLFIYESWALIDFFTRRKTKSNQQDCYHYLRNHLSEAFKILEKETKKLHLDLLDSIKNKKIKNYPLSRYNGLKNFRRIVAFLHMERPKKVDKRKQDVVFYAKISILALLLISAVALSICLIFGVLKGGLI